MKSGILKLCMALLATVALAGQAAAYCEGTNKVSDADSTCMSASWAGAVANVTNSCDWTIRIEVEGIYLIPVSDAGRHGPSSGRFAYHPTLVENSSNEFDYSHLEGADIEDVSCCTDGAACSSESE